MRTRIVSETSHLKILLLRSVTRDSGCTNLLSIQFINKFNASRNLDAIARKLHSGFCSH